PGDPRNTRPKNHQTGDPRLRVVAGCAGRGDLKAAVSPVLDTDGKRSQSGERSRWNERLWRRRRVRAPQSLMLIQIFLGILDAGVRQLKGLFRADKILTLAQLNCDARGSGERLPRQQDQE